MGFFCGIFPRPELPMLRLAAVILAVLAGLAAGGSAGAEPRTALVIGNAAYPDAPLANPVADATAVAAALEAGGFEVAAVLDADQATMDRAIAAFGERLRARGG